MAFSGLGAVIELDPKADLRVAQLQQAINRVIVGASKDSRLPQALKDLVRSSDVQPVAITGILGDFTNLQFRFAKTLSGVIDPSTLTTVSQLELAARNLNAAADTAGYAPHPHTVTHGSIAKSVADALDPSAKGFSTTTLVIGGSVLALGAAFLLLRRSR